MAPRLRTTFLLGLLAGLVVALVRALSREGRTPAPAPLATPRPALPVTPRPAPVAHATPAPVADAAPEAAADATATWTAPVDGGCPEGYPIKAKESSRIFHQPGGLSYERTNPDRCYPDAAAAAADGFRAAKR